MLQILTQRTIWVWTIRIDSDLRETCRRNLPKQNCTHHRQVPPWFWFHRLWNLVYALFVRDGHVLCRVYPFFFRSDLVHATSNASFSSPFHVYHLYHFYLVRVYPPLHANDFFSSYGHANDSVCRVLFHELSAILSDVEIYRHDLHGNRDDDLRARVPNDIAHVRAHYLRDQNVWYLHRGRRVWCHPNHHLYNPGELQCISFSCDLHIEIGIGNMIEAHLNVAEAILSPSVLFQHQPTLAYHRFSYHQRVYMQL